jgi:hypothetical protein
MVNVVIFYGQLEYITAIWYILLSFGNLVIIWYIFHRFGVLCQEKSGNPDRGSISRQQNQKLTSMSDTNGFDHGSNQILMI